VSVPIVRLDSGSASGPSAVAGSVDALIGQFYFAKQLDPRLSPVSCLCFVPLMRQMWAGCHDGSISVYNVDNYQLVEDRDGSQEPITCMVFDNKDSVWCGSADSKISQCNNKEKLNVTVHRYTCGMSKQKKGGY
jgi:WD40 repeat protein